MLRTDFPGEMLLESGTSLGFAAANNLAVPRAAGELVLFLNPDTSVKKGALLKMVAFMKTRKEVGALGPRMVEPDGRPYELGLQWFPTPFREFLRMLLLTRDNASLASVLFPYHDPAREGYVSKLYGGCLMVRRCLLEEVGAFDERFFMYWEDVDLCRRISDHGKKLYYLPWAEVTHWSGSASRKAGDDFAVLTQCDSASKLMSKYYGWPEVYLYRVAVFAASAARMLLLALLWPCSRMGRPGKGKYGASFGKYRAMIMWSLDPARLSGGGRRGAGGRACCTIARGSRG